MGKDHKSIPTKVDWRNPQSILQFRKDRRAKGKPIPKDLKGPFKVKEVNEYVSLKMWNGSYIKITYEQFRAWFIAHDDGRLL